MASILYLLFLLFLFSFEAAESLQVGSRSILRAISGPDPPDAAVDLNITNFDSVLSDSPASFAIVEFFAHWCPACRNYKPHYEKVARLFNGREAVHPGIILMTRVDCALKINTKLCDKFSVGHYPMLLWGPPSKFASGSWEPKQKSEIIAIDDGRTADRLLNWINKKMGRHIVRAVYDVEEATSSAFDIILDHKMINSVTRAPLIGFLQLLVAHHPSRRCRKGSAEVLVNFDEFWPSDLWASNKQEAIVSRGKDAIQSLRICGKEAPRGYWIFCRGSKNETRGFSCGLWVLLHSVSVRIEDGESQFAFRSTCDFIHNFFICQECRQHFHEMCSSITSPFKKTADFALWLWTAHNQVNERLMKEEADLKTGDPKFPKMIWPPKQLCPSCYLSPPSRRKDGSMSIDWNRDEVFKFLVGYYGKMLVSSNKDSFLEEEKRGSSLADEVVTSTNVVAVPLGAALGIALASCAFGALACFWRSRQKNRKQRRPRS
ncbi:Erv1/Alr [Macleaya cordata]|uniref:Sulfhydryl oxidase n=1 Tax=Macleaya cordata TaxID=56857 RepID=A0A200QVM9_MACCD|nr:Erv1/Alr [Macleaya cordata]